MNDKLENLVIRSNGEKGVSIALMAQLLNVDERELKALTEKPVKVFNGKGIKSNDPYSYKAPADIGNCSYNKLDHSREIIPNPATSPLIVGWFGRSIDMDSFNQRISLNENNREKRFKADINGVLFFPVALHKDIEERGKEFFNEHVEQGSSK